MRNRVISTAITALALAGCAHAPKVQTASLGQWPKGGGFAFNDAAKYYGADSPAYAPLRQCLGEQASGAKPAYLVQLARTVRPAHAKVLAPADATLPDHGREPLKSKRLAEELSVSITDIASAKEVWRGMARVALKKDGKPQDDLLAGELCKAIGAAKA